LQDIKYRVEHRFGSSNDIMIPESQDQYSLFFKKCSTSGILELSLGMLPSVQFNNHPHRVAVEVDNERWHRMLSPPLVTLEARRTKMAPEQALHMRRSRPKLTGEGSGSRWRRRF
jgi:hypothetical protein